MEVRSEYRAARSSRRSVPRSTLAWTGLSCGHPPFDLDHPTRCIAGDVQPHHTKLEELEQHPEALDVEADSFDDSYDDPYDPMEFAEEDDEF